MNAFCIACLLLITATGSNGYTQQSQRQLFKAAEKALAAENRLLYTTLAVMLQDYPLYPYLVYSDLRQRLKHERSIDEEIDTETNTETNTEIDTEIQQFTKNYSATPLAGKLRNIWLQQLAKQQRWNIFLDHYQHVENTNLQCLQRQALLHTGQAKEALKDISQLWLSPKSLPDNCDPLFTLWKALGDLTPVLIWQRFALAINANQAGLAGYLRNLMTGKDRETASLWLAVHNKPEIVLEKNRFDINKPYTTTILLHGIRRWSRKDSVTAAPALDTLKQRYEFPDQLALQTLERRLAVYLAGRRHPQAAQRLAAVPAELVDNDVEAWRIRVALYQQDWNSVLRWTQALSEHNKNNSDWRYWQARALDATGKQQQAREIYLQLSQQRDYYGFLAAERLNIPYNIRSKALNITEKSLQQLQQQAVWLRVSELFFLGRTVAAKQEWEQALDDLNHDGLLAVAVMLHRWGWHNLAIATLGRAQAWDYLTLRFPLPYRQLVINYAGQYSLDPAWIYAVMRQESLFQSNARSGVGARGLMQIMPATGSNIARELDAKNHSTAALSQPRRSIQYGSYYLRQNLDRLQNNITLATAAYNAGPARIKKWLPGKDALPADIWIEIIPFAETRKYVKRVLEYSTVYEKLLGRPQTPMHQRMLTVLNNS